MNNQPTVNRERFWGATSLVFTLLIVWLFSISTGAETDFGLALIFPFFLLFAAIAFALSLKFLISNMLKKEKVPESVRKQRLIYNFIGIFAPLILAVLMTADVL